MTRKKIGVIVYSNPDYYPPTVSAILLLAKYYDVILVGRNFEQPTREYPLNVSIYRLGNYSSAEERSQLSSFGKIIEYLKFIRDAYSLLQHTDLIYAYEPYAFVASYLVKFRCRGKQAIIYQCHEIPERIEGLGKLVGWVQRLEKRWINQANLIILPEKTRAEIYQNMMEIQQIPMVVPNFPLKSLFPVLPELNSLIEKRWNQPVLFYRGTISDAISMREIFRSLQFLPEAWLKRVQIQFAGYLNALDAKAIDLELKNLNLTDQYIFWGALPYTEANLATITTTIGFCLYKPSSKNTGTMSTSSNKIFEYAGCYLPVIVSDTNNFRSFFAGEEWVHFANPDHPEAIAGAVSEILADFEQYKHKCMAARRAFEQRFNYENAFNPVIRQIDVLIQGK